MSDTIARVAAAMRNKRRKDRFLFMLKSMPTVISCFSKKKLLDRLGSVATLVHDTTEFAFKGDAVSYEDARGLMHGYESLPMASSTFTFIESVLAKSKNAVCVSDAARHQVWNTNINGVTFAWMVFDARPDYIWYDSKHSSYPEMLAALSEELWKRSTAHNILKIGTTMVDGELELQVLGLNDGLDSLKSLNTSTDPYYIPEFALEKVNVFRRCLALGINRSLVMYGPPGTGKSIAAEIIATELGLRTLKISVADAKNLDSTTINSFIELVAPEALIIDDLDRLNNYEKMFDTLQYYNSNIKLLIATMNDIDVLDPALIRPGRFDEVVHVKYIDESIVSRYLKPGIEHYDEIKLWPITYVKEFAKRLLIYKDESIEKHFDELAKRVATPVPARARNSEEYCVDHDEE